MITLTTLGRNASLAGGICTAANGGRIAFRSSSNVVLLYVALGATAFGAPSGGTATARGGDGTNPISSGNPLVSAGLAAAGAGTAITNFVVEDDENAALWSGSVGAIGSGEDCELVNVNIAEDQPFVLNTFTHTQPASEA